MTHPGAPRPRRLVEFREERWPPLFAVYDRGTDLYLAALPTERAREDYCLRQGFWPVETTGEGSNA